MPINSSVFPSFFHFSTPVPQKMTKTIFTFLLICVLLSQAKHLLRKSKSLSKDFSCDHPFVLISWQYNLPLTLINISYDSQNVAKYADLQLDQNNEATTSWCKLDDGRIQNVETGLYLDVHGPGLVCWAQYSCEWATQVDAYYTEGTSWIWKDAIAYKTYHQLQTMGRSLTAYSAGTVNLGVTDLTNKAQAWMFHWTK